ncbi:MAG TPA: thioredoxin domain-containing protein [Pyrinomonadaceae bacterium]|nr:thioredoxin domain-containing protein [Pyrinomonadaceae bacterium]
MSAKRHARPASPKPGGGGPKRFLPFIIIGGVLAVVVGTAVVFMRSNDPGAASNNDPAAAKTGANAAAPPAPRRSPLPGAQPPHSVGPETAPVTLEEFGDFQCPPCGRMHPLVQEIEKDYGDRLRFVYRHFPLQQLHKNAFSAARAAEAAGMQGKFWEMHDLIFDNQLQWAESPEPRNIFNDYARRLGLSVEKFQSDMARQDVADRVMADYQRGNSLGVTGTPTFFVNGRELPGTQALDPAYLRAQIDQALGAAGRR